MGVPFFCPYENMKNTKVLHGFYLLNIWQYGHLQVSPPSPAISQAVGQTKPLLSHSEHLTKIENMSDNTDQTVVLCVYFRVCWLHHVPFQSWFHDNLCSSSKGMEKPVFERNYSMYIYIYLYYVIKIRFHRWLGLPKGKHGQIISTLGPYRTDPKNQAITPMDYYLPPAKLGFHGNFMGNSLCFCFLTNPQEPPKTKFSAIPAQQLAEALDFWLPACGADDTTVSGVH